MENIWNENGEAYMTRDGRIISLNQARSQGKIVDLPFEKDGTGYLRNGKIYASKEDADNDY